jgi:hypothetical protein
MDEQEDFDAACWAQQEQDERREREDRLLARHRVLLDEFRRDNAAYEKQRDEFHQRMRTMTCL